MTPTFQINRIVPSNRKSRYAKNVFLNPMPRPDYMDQDTYDLGDDFLPARVRSIPAESF